MDTNEIMQDENIIEATEQIATAGLDKGLVIGVAVGLVTLAGFAAYKWIVKPIVAKIKKKNNTHTIVLEADGFEVSNEEESNEPNE